MRVIDIIALVAITSLIPVDDIDAQTTHRVPADQPSIQAAIDAAVDGDVVLIAPGVYHENLVIVQKDLVLRGAGPEASVVDGSQQVLPVLRVVGGQVRAVVTIEGLRFEGGRGRLSAPDGVRAEAGGIDLERAAATIRDCVIANNVGSEGRGGLRCGAGGLSVMQGGALHVDGCRFEYNLGGPSGPLPGDGDGGPGAALITSGQPVFHACVFIGNEGGDGHAARYHAGAGAITSEVFLTPLLLDDCVFRNNQGGRALHDDIMFFAGAGAVTAYDLVATWCVFADNEGGDAWSPYMSLRAGAGAMRVDHGLLDGCIFRGNRGGKASLAAGYGGSGAIDADGDIRLRSSLVVGNEGGAMEPPLGLQAGAGGLWQRGGVAQIIGCTFADNLGGPGNVPGVAGAIQLQGVALILDSILWNDLDGYGGPREIGGAAAPIVQHCDIAGGYAGVANSNLDPLFVAPAAGDYHLGPTSPCRDAGGAAMSAHADRDLDGEARIMGPGPDQGADEYGFSLLPGTAEDLELESRVNGREPARGSVKLITTGDRLDLLALSPGGHYPPGALWLIGSARPSSAPPLLLPLLPGCHVDPAALIILAPSTFVAASQPLSQGMVFTMPVTQSHPGWSLYVQALALDPAAGNGFFALSEAHELRFHCGPGRWMKPP
ncbi:MAG: hypothetical protein H6807_04140 [Planctomycetes bacterium]|nr:hypothetical protein [Planctomycetota bacterium]